jgi:hypothetical protein
MSRRAAPSVDWHLLSLEQLEQHARDLKELGKSPTAAFTRACGEPADSTMTSEGLPAQMRLPCRGLSPR